MKYINKCSRRTKCSPVLVGWGEARGGRAQRCTRDARRRAARGGGGRLHRNDPLEGDIGLIIIIYDLSEAAPRLALVARPITSSLIDGTGTLFVFY